MSKLHRTYRWKKLRATLLAKNCLCRKCGRLATEIDHIRPVAKGGMFWSVRNLQPLCRPCHEAKTASENRGPLPKVCVHGWRSDFGPCPDCGPAGTDAAKNTRSRDSGGA